MDTKFSLNETEKKVMEFYTLPLLSLNDAAAIENYKRTSIGPVEILEIGELQTKNMLRRTDQIGHGGRTALLTLWGKPAQNLDVQLNKTYNVFAIKPGNDFNYQRSYNSTISITFQGISEEECAELQFSGEIESVSFENNLVEIDGDLLRISKEKIEKLFPENIFISGIKMEGKRKRDEIVEIQPIKAQKSTIKSA
ncbi:uncharacterized protein LOC125664647 [Ostrea edulis]|uniref:uncharacterized protein LOC125664647 n=1 Tax=Ostrea edulis TaxID=37623 RepID=UPI0024AE90CA|nr:uncharacterized protein LOC125664647 [Ostrea edulis]